jgi:carboxylesterase
MPLMPEADPWSIDGDRTGVLVLHGFTGSPKSVKPWGRALGSQGWTVRVPRLPGHGTRWQDMNITTWEDWYAEADRNLRDLQDACDRVFVMGLSMGGSLTLRLAQQHGSAISGIVLVNPAVHTERPDRFLLPLLSRLVPSFPGVSNDIAKPGVDEGAYDRLPLRAAHSLSQMWSLVKADLPLVSQPLLLFRSAQDHVVEASNSAYILANVSSTQAVEVVLERSYHVATLDHDADVITEGSIDFVRGLS